MRRRRLTYSEHKWDWNEENAKAEKQEMLCWKQWKSPKETPRTKAIRAASVQNICWLCVGLGCQNKKKTGHTKIKPDNIVSPPLSSPLRPVLNVLADSDEESSSAASSDEDEPPGLSEPQGPVGEKGITPPADGYVLFVSNNSHLPSVVSSFTPHF